MATACASETLKEFLERIPFLLAKVYTKHGIAIGIPAKGVLQKNGQFIFNLS